MENKVICKRPKIVSVEAALKVYYSNIDLGNKELRELFGSLSSATLVRLKREVKKQMEEEGVMSYRLNAVSKEVAYRMWGLDIQQLEKQQAKLNRLTAICGGQAHA